MVDVLESYEDAGFFDEVVDGEGGVRTHYEPLFRRLSGFSAEELSRRQRLKDAIFHTQGITFTVYGDEEGTERTFPLDLVPRIIPAEEWQLIESGLIQRVRALNVFLEDLYAGDESILGDEVIPRRLVESADGYLPQARGIPAPHGARCVVAGIDLVRGADGRYRVLEDNLRTPSGVSYVLENRSAMTRVLPVAFHQSGVRPVDHYPNLLLDALRTIAPGHHLNPRVVLLTPGRYNSAYFEHAFLARQMGIDLVEAQDLIVIDEAVYMRTTRGLRQVDVIYRRIDDEFLDPSVFRPDSLLGVSGLVAAARAGNVTLCNALGNGAADDKALYSYVPEMIRYYLGEQPLLDNVETYLLEDPDRLEMVLGRLDELVVKPVAGSGGYGMLIGPAASDEDIARFARQLRDDPRGYIAQEVVQLSRSPTLIDGKLEGRHVDLRPFVVSGEKIQVLPGGLTRVALRKGSLVVNSSQGGGSKDTWVLAATDPAVDIEPRQSARSARQPELVLARVAADLYWAGRYLERAQDTARLLDVTYHSVLEDHPDSAAYRLRELVDVLLLGPEFDNAGLKPDPDTLARFLVADTGNPGSVRSSIATARENLRTIQDKVSRELWETLNSFHISLAGDALEHELRTDQFGAFTRIRRGCQMVIGSIDDTMSHNDGWRFLTMGRAVERGIVTARLLDVYMARLVSEDHAIAFHHWVSVLRSAGAFQEYQKVFQASIDPTDAIEFLLQAREFPRSVLRCINRIRATLAPVRHEASGVEAWRKIGLIQAEVEYADVGTVIESDLRRFLADIVTRLEEFSDTVTAEFFALPETSDGPAEDGTVEP